jgi:curli biogenesis system outer membrane secretion channel CsgG
MPVRRSSLCAAVAGGVLFFCVVPHLCAQEIASKKRVAVLNFDNPPVGTDAPKGLFGVNGEDVGKGASVLLIQKLVEGGKYTVVDRSSLEQLLKEQKASDRNEMDAYGMAAKIGRLLGLDAMIIGAITHYAPDEKEKGEAAVSLPGVLHARKAKATVGLTAQVFNVSTGEVAASFTSEGESTNTGQVLILGPRGHGASEMLGSEFAASLFPEATRSAVEHIAVQLNAFADKIPALSVTVEGLVADVEGNTLTLNLGKRSGVKIGDRLKIVRDAASKANSGNVKEVPVATEPIGIATVTEVAEEYVTATFSGPGHPQTGDRIVVAEKESTLPH